MGTDMSEDLCGDPLGERQKLR